MEPWTHRNIWKQVLNKNKSKALDRSQNMDNVAFLLVMLFVYVYDRVDGAMCGSKSILVFVK